MILSDVLNSKEFVEQFNYGDKNKIGVLFSSFDCMHAGHMIMLKDAKVHCDYLIVGLQTDPTIDRADTKNKPIMSIEERYEMILGCKYIDEIFIYENEKQLYEFLRDFDWDIRILGSDWEGKEYTGHDINNGEIYFHKRDHNYSSTDIRKRIYERELKKINSK